MRPLATNTSSCTTRIPPDRRWYCQKMRSGRRPEENVDNSIRKERWFVRGKRIAAQKLPLTSGSLLPHIHLQHGMYWLNEWYYSIAHFFPYQP